MLSSVTNYILWFLGTALPTFISSEPCIFFVALMALSIVLSFVVRFLKPPKF